MDNYPVEKRRIDTLRPDPNQPPKFFNQEDVDNLAQSIRKVGIINPIEIDPNGTIITGENRFRAAKQAGLREVPCRVVSVGSQERLERQLHENLHQSAMTPMEIARGLYKTFGYRDQDHKSVEIAKKIGKTDDWVRAHLRLLDLDKDVAQVFVKNKLGVTTVSAINRIKKLEDRGMVASGTTKDFTQKITNGQIRNTDSAGRLAKAIAENPGVAEDYLRPDYSGKNEIEVQAILDNIAPTIQYQIWDLSTACEGMDKLAKSLTRRLKDYPHANLGAGRSFLVQDLKELKKAMESWHPSL